MVHTGGEEAAGGNKKAPVVKLNPWPTGNMPDGSASARRLAAAAADPKRVRARIHIKCHLHDSTSRNIAVADLVDNVAEACTACIAMLRPSLA